MKQSKTSRQDLRHERAIEEGRRIIEAKIGKKKCDKYFAPRDHLHETEEESLLRVIRDARALEKLHVALADPTGRISKKDHDLARAISILVTVKSMGADSTVENALDYVTIRLLDMSDEDRDSWMKEIVRMKKNVTRKVAGKKRAVVTLLANEFRMTHGGLIRRKKELYRFIKEAAHSSFGLWFPPESNFQEWTKIMREAGLSHIGGHPGKCEEL